MMIDEVTPDHEHFNYTIILIELNFTRNLFEIVRLKIMEYCKRIFLKVE